MNIQAIINFLETVAPPVLQEDYDNAGLMAGDPVSPCTGVLLALDATEEVLAEAEARGCNLVVTHHPLIFGGLKRVTGDNATGRTLIRAIRSGISVYAIHTNLDNVLHGVNGRIAARLGLVDTRVLKPAAGALRKMYVFAPTAHVPALMDAIFLAGGGHIGNYSECSFLTEGKGSFLPGKGTDPFVGSHGQRHAENETRVEFIFPHWLQAGILSAMRAVHPYEEMAYDVVALENDWGKVGSGLVGELPEPEGEKDFLARVRRLFDMPVIRHTRLSGRPLRRVALCGGAGSFLISNAIAAGAEVFLTSDLKYHEFFRAEDRILLADFGHYEGEQYTSDLLADLLKEKFPTFAVLKSGVNTNPVNYLI
jgi:dinuclear metal center YbgI/SA1388 family protein